MHWSNLHIPRVGGEDVRLMVWDTAGQEEFDTITRAYYRCDHLSYTGTRTAHTRCRTCGNSE